MIERIQDWVRNKMHRLQLIVHFNRNASLYLKGVHKKTFTNVNTALNTLFRGQDGIFYIKVFVYYIHERFIINFAHKCLDFI